MERERRDGRERAQLPCGAPAMETHLARRRCSWRGRPLASPWAHVRGGRMHGPVRLGVRALCRAQITPHPRCGKLVSITAIPKKTRALKNALMTTCPFCGSHAGRSGQLCAPRLCRIAVRAHRPEAWSLLVQVARQEPEPEPEPQPELDSRYARDLTQHNAWRTGRPAQVSEQWRPHGGAAALPACGCRAVAPCLAAASASEQPVRGHVLRVGAVG